MMGSFSMSEIHAKNSFSAILSEDADVIHLEYKTWFSKCIAGNNEVGNTLYVSNHSYNSSSKQKNAGILRFSSTST